MKFILWLAYVTLTIIIGWTLKTIHTLLTN